MQIEYPVYWTAEEFCDGFLKLIDHLELDKVCVRGEGMGEWERSQEEGRQGKEGQLCATKD